MTKLLKLTAPSEGVECAALQPRSLLLWLGPRDSVTKARMASSTYFGMIGKKPRSYRVIVFLAMPSLWASSRCVRPRLCETETEPLTAKLPAGQRNEAT